MFGINPSEFIVLLVVAAVVLGPERLPEYAAQLARLVRELRRMAQGASSQVRNEMGSDFDDIDWAKLDPRQYDPRRIVREALADVWDPDDPLGLKVGNRPGQAGDEDFDQADFGGRNGNGEKPQSGGGPATARRDVENGSHGSVSLTKSDATVQPPSNPPAPVVPPPPAFDPDAT